MAQYYNFNNPDEYATIGALKKPFKDEYGEDVKLIYKGKVQFTHFGEHLWTHVPIILLPGT